MVFNRFSRFTFAILVLLLVAAVGRAEGECSAEGDCANPEVTSDATPEVASDATPEAAAEEDPGCPSRPYVIRCARQYLDTNKNEKLERAELQAGIDKLPWYGRGILKVLGSVDKIMAKCDIDGDDAIGMGYDMEHNQDQCLATCFKRRAFKSAFFPDCE